MTEGEITEVQYLQGLAQHQRRSGVTVIPSTVQGAGGEPSRVLAKARAIASKGDYEAVWIVVDVDDHASLREVLVQCRTGAETVVVSNPQFEVWLLWHFSHSGAPQTPASLKQQLRRNGFTGTCKHLPTDFPFDRVDQAVVMATQKERTVPPNASGGNPSSSMPHLVDALRAR